MTKDTPTWPKKTWPQDGLGGQAAGLCPPLEAVQEWISAALPGQPPIGGPLAIHRLKAWGLTARFSTGAAEVFFKVCLLPIFFDNPLIYQVLNRHCSEVVPRLLAWRLHTDRLGHSQLWTLFNPVAGRPLYETGRFDLLLEAARTLARIQTAVAAAPATELKPLPRRQVEEIPLMLDVVQREIRDVYAAAWAADPDEEDWGQHLATWRPRLETWARELAVGQWPQGPDHVDFHSENALVDDTDTIRLVDWEETVLNCPFFSLERLLADAAAAETACWQGRPRAPEGEATLDMGPCEMAVRRAYLTTLPWQQLAARERAFDLAMCLAPIKYAYESALFNRALGRPHGHPGETGWFMKKGLERWRAARF